MTLTIKHMRILKNMTAIILFITAIISLNKGIKLVLTGDIFNAVYAIPKFIWAIIEVYIAAILKYTIAIKR